MVTLFCVQYTWPNAAQLVIGFLLGSCPVAISVCLFYCYPFSSTVIMLYSPVNK